MKQFRRKQHTERGSAFVSLLTVIGLLGLTAGGAMLATEAIILDTAKNGDESMHASRLGTERDTQSGNSFRSGTLDDIGEAPVSDRELSDVSNLASPEGAYEPLDRDRLRGALGIPSDFEGSAAFVEGAEYDVADSGGIATDAVLGTGTNGVDEGRLVDNGAPRWIEVEGGPFERTQYLESSGLAYEIGADGERTGRTWNTENGEVQEPTDGLFGYSDWTWGLSGWSFSPGLFTPGQRTVEQNDDWIMDTSVFDQREINYFQEAPLLSLWANEDNERGIYTTPTVGGVMEGAGIAPIAGLVDSGLGLVGGNWQWAEDFARDANLAATSSAAGRDAAMVTTMITLFADVLSFGGTSLRHTRHLDSLIPTGGTALTPGGRTITPALKSRIDGLEGNLSDLTIMPGENKSGLLQYLSEMPDEYIVYRAQHDGLIHVTRGTSGSVIEAHDASRLIFHNHPNGFLVLSEGDIKAFIQMPSRSHLLGGRGEVIRVPFNPADAISSLFGARVLAMKPGGSMKLGPLLDSDLSGVRRMIENSGLDHAVTRLADGTVVMTRPPLANPLNISRGTLDAPHNLGDFRRSGSELLDNGPTHVRDDAGRVFRVERTTLGEEWNLVESGSLGPAPSFVSPVNQ